MTITGSPISFIASTSAAESRQFYETVLGLKCLSEDQFALVFDLGQSTLRIQIVDSLPEVNHTVFGWKVDDIHGSVTNLTGKGVRFERFSGMSQDDLGIWSSPSGASVAWFKDPDGNTLSLTAI